jgi:hypothetical protein
MITLITFPNDEIAVKEYIYSVKIPYIQTVRAFHTSMMILKIAPHNKDFQILTKAMCFSLLY